MNSYQLPLLRKHVLPIVAVVGLLVFALIFRTIKLGEFTPIRGDEYSLMYAGASLIETGAPVGWTIFYRSYKQNIIPQKVFIDGDSWYLVKPFLDHPPLFAVLSGSWAIMTGEIKKERFSWDLLRAPMILISLLTLIFTFRFVCKLYGFQAALCTLAAYSFFPSAVITARFIMPEHLIALLLVLAFNIYAAIDSKPRSCLFSLASIFAICLLAPLLKLSGAVIPATLILLALFDRRYLISLLSFTGMVSSFLLFIIYGWYYGIDLFWEVLKAHNERAQSLFHFWSLFTKLNIGHTVFLDVSVIVGLIGSLILAYQENKTAAGKYMLAALFSFAAVFSWVAPVESYGWYKFSLYPLLAIGNGYLWWRFLHGSRLLACLLVPQLLLLMELGRLLPADPLYYKLVILSIFAISGLLFLASNHSLLIKIQLSIRALLLLLLMLLQGYWIWQVFTNV